MKIDNFFQNRFMDRTAKILSRTLDFRSANQQVISGNLANVDTPGFTPKQISFDSELQKAAGKAGISLKKTDPGHFSRDSDFNNTDFPLETMDPGEMGSSELNIDAEMAKMSQNNLLYEASVRLLSKKFQALRAAIEGARR